MKTKLLLITLLFATMPAVNAQNRERDYLKKVFANLEKMNPQHIMLLTKAGNPGTPPHYPFYMDSSKNIITP